MPSIFNFSIFKLSLLFREIQPTLNNLNDFIGSLLMIETILEPEIIFSVSKGKSICRFSSLNFTVKFPCETGLFLIGAM